MGQILAEKLGVVYYNLDDEIKALYQITLEEFVHTGTLMERDRKRGKLIGQLIKKRENSVIAITPMSYPEYFNIHLKKDNVFAIEVFDHPQHIFDRLVFSDENDGIYKDDEYKNARKDYYMREIIEDLQSMFIKE
ncbi:MAG: hypothetical protein HUJ53_03390 [Holdemanella sp.]|nr:hypothetical protein [Holdemanella sp.]